VGKPKGMNQENIDRMLFSLKFAEMSFEEKVHFPEKVPKIFKFEMQGSFFNSP